MLCPKVYYYLIIYFQTAFYVSHLPMIAQFNLDIVSTIESKLIIIASKTSVIRLTSVQVTFKCIQIITARIQRYIRKAFSDIERQRNVWFSIVFSMVNVQHIFTVEDASTRLRTKLTWVRNRISLISMNFINNF